MAKRKGILKLLVLSVVLLLSAIVLFACGKDEEPKYEFSAGANGSVIEKTVDGQRAWQAVPDKWHEFVGWYNGNRKYSEDETLKVKSSTPTNLVARFATSAKSTFDRYLESFYNTYVDGENKEGQYFNYSLDSDVIYIEGDKNISKDATINGYFDFSSSSQFAFVAKDKDETEFALYYDDNAENGNIYVQIGEDKYSYTDIGLITNIFTFLPNSSNVAWKVDDIITDEDTQYIIDQYFGIKNSMAFINEVENGNNTSLINISYHKILNLLKNIANSSADASALERLIYALTCEYTTATLPEMLIEIKTTYSSNSSKEYIDKIEFKFVLNNNYTVNFDGNKYTLPKMEASFIVNSFDYGYSKQANSISKEVLSSFPKPTVNMINIHADGELNFLSVEEGNETVVDKYLIELDTDINPFAVMAFKNAEVKSYDDIEWEKLGFLSFRVSLVNETDSEAYLAQQLRHNEDYEDFNRKFGYVYQDYLNILIDTKNNGANVYVYLGLYNPQTPFSRNYILNHSFNIPSLLDMIEMEEEEQSFKPTTILNVLSSLVVGSLNIGKGASPAEIVQNLLYETLSLIGVEKEVVDNNFTMNEDGARLSLSEIRKEIREYESQTLNNLIGLSQSLNLDKVVFGDDESDKINYISVKMNKPSQNAVTKNAEGQYLSADGKVVAEQFNNAHKVIVGIDKTTGIAEVNNAQNIDEIISLEGQTLNISNALLSDGSITSEFINNKGQTTNTAYKKINMIVEKVEVKLENNVYKLKLIMQIQDTSNSVSTSVGNLGEELYSMLGLPYGLVVYQTELTF